MTNPSIREVDGGVVFVAKVVPGSSKTAVCGLLNGMVKFKLSAPPQKGKANQSLIQFLAKRLGVKKNAVSIITGHTTAIKDVQVLGISTETLLKKMNLNT